MSENNSKTVASSIPISMPNTTDSIVDRKPIDSAAAITSAKKQAARRTLRLAIPKLQQQHAENANFGKHKNETMTKLIQNERKSNSSARIGRNVQQSDGIGGMMGSGCNRNLNSADVSRVSSITISPENDEFYFKENQMPDMTSIVEMDSAKGKKKRTKIGKKLKKKRFLKVFFLFYSLERSPLSTQFMELTSPLSPLPTKSRTFTQILSSLSPTLQCNIDEASKFFL